MASTARIASVNAKQQKPAATLQIDKNAPQWRRRWRKPLYDPPPPPPPKIEKKVLPPLRSKLLGTIIEPGASKAMINLPGRGVAFLAQGDSLGAQDQNGVLVEIGPSSVKVKRGDEVTELKVEGGF